MCGAAVRGAPGGIGCVPAWSEVRRVLRRVLGRVLTYVLGRAVALVPLLASAFRLGPEEHPVSDPQPVEHHPRRTRRQPDRPAAAAATVSPLRRPIENRQPLVDIECIAEYLGDSVRHIRRLVDEKRIPYFKVGRLVRFDRAEIDRWLEDNRPSGP